MFLLNCNYSFNAFHKNFTQIFFCVSTFPRSGHVQQKQFSFKSFSSASQRCHSCLYKLIQIAFLKDENWAKMIRKFAINNRKFQNLLSYPMFTPLRNPSGLTNFSLTKISWKIVYLCNDVIYLNHLNKKL